MGWRKKHDRRTPIFKVICVNDNNTRLLKKGVRYVLEETETEYLVQFRSGAANWYAKSRFITEPLKPQPKPQPQLNKLF